VKVHLQNIEVTFEFQGHWVNVKVTAAKKRPCECMCSLRIQFKIAFAVTDISHVYLSVEPEYNAKCRKLFHHCTAFFDCNCKLEDHLKFMWLSRNFNWIIGLCHLCANCYLIVFYSFFICYSSLSHICSKIKISCLVTDINNSFQL